MATRAKRLIYLGKDGDRKGDYFQNVPARDLEEGDIAALTDAQYADCTGEHPTQGALYVSEPSSEAKRSERTAKDGE